MRKIAVVAALAAPLAGASALAQNPSSPAAAGFESPQVHPLDVAPGGDRLAVVNTPDARLAVFTLADPSAPLLLREVSTAMEPVTARFRTDAEVWVVCHLADAVQVIDVDSGVVTATLAVGDEPSDVVFAGGKAFVTLATGREVLVLDAGTHAELARLPIDGDEPRFALASADGSRVWVAAHKSGNGTTLVPAARAPAQPPPTNPRLPAPPQVGLIVAADDPQWRAAHGIELPDHDVFEVDVAALTVSERVSGVGTILFGMAERPTDGSLWVANTEARNLIRYEPELRGRFTDNRVTRIEFDGSASVRAFDLDGGFDKQRLPNPALHAAALAQPTDVVWSPDGSELFVAGFGSDRIGVLDHHGIVLARIDVGPDPAGEVDPRHKRGPRGLAMHPAGAILYVLNRLSNSVSVIDTRGRAELREVALFDPTPEALREARGFLYDARLSGNGTVSCASCHIDGGSDGLAWDLGDPDGEMRRVETVNGTSRQVHPMKGPMTTQTLRGLRRGGNLHWRGEMRGVQDFNPAWRTLLGGRELSPEDIGAFEDFVHTLRFAPNPHRELDGTLPGGSAASRGEALFRQVISGGVYSRPISCTDCHTEPDGSGIGPVDPGITGLQQPFRPAGLREVYRRQGRAENARGVRTAGFGLRFDGSHDDVHGHLEIPAFRGLSDAQRTDLQAFVEAFDTGTAPAVGAAVALDATLLQDPVRQARRATLRAQAAAGGADVVVRGRIGERDIGLLWDPAAAVYRPDRAGDTPVEPWLLDLLIANGVVRATLQGVPPGTGRRYALDREGDGVLDGDQRAMPAYGAPSGARALWLAANRPPARGTADFALVGSGGAPGAAGAVLVGARAASIDLLGVRLLVDPAAADALSVTADARGTAVLPLRLPDRPALAGLELQTQLVLIDAAGRLSASAGRTLRVR